MLRLFFPWLDQHPFFYVVVVGIVTAGTVAGFFRCWNATQETRAQRVIEALLWLAFLLAWRWPWLLTATEMNPDESQFVAGAITLTKDPIFWRSVDGTTSGPLNYYVLLPLHALGLPLDYFWARAIGLLLVWTGLVALRRALAQCTDSIVAGVTTLAAATFFATTTDADFIHYSSEHLSLAIVPLVAWLVLRTERAERHAALSLLLAAALAGLLPWSKLQTAPLSGVLIIWAAVAARKRGWLPAGVMLTGIFPTALIGAAVAVTGQWAEMWQRYFLQNILYVANSQPPFEAWLNLSRRAAEQGAVCWLLLAAAIAVIAAGWRMARGAARPTLTLGSVAALATAAVVAVAVPKRDFLHYVLLLVFPSALLGGLAWTHAVAGGSLRARQIAQFTALLIGFVAPIAMRATQGAPGMFGDFADHWRRPHFVDGAVLRVIAQPSDRLAVWGWSPRTNVESRIPQATRDPHTSWLILDGPLRDRFRQTYLEDFRRHMPAFFLDATGPGAFYFTSRAESGHEMFRELADEIARNYTLFLDPGFSRLYVRNDRLATAQLSPAIMASIRARSRRAEMHGVELPAATTGDVHRKTIEGRDVLALHAPASVEWTLDESSRGIEIEYAFEPAALKAGLSNGVEIALDLVRQGQAQLVFERPYDPVRHSQEHGPQKNRIVFPLGVRAGDTARLQVKPGREGDNAWDWIALSRASMIASPTFLPDQFPGFNRLPTRTEVGHAEILLRGDERFLALHTPTRLEFTLAGDERVLEWSYGILPGAYTNGGESDGVEFTVLLEAEGQRRELAKQHLDPRAREADRPEQSRRVKLPSHSAGDRLVIVLGPASNPAWDWAYISRLTLN